MASAKLSSEILAHINELEKAASVDPRLVGRGVTLGGSYCLVAKKKSVMPSKTHTCTDAVLPDDDANQ